MATTSISLIREQSEKVRPVRALWVPFALGRPLGSAEHPEIQKQVMRQAFDLLDTATEPTIGDYTGEVPDEAGPEQWACPLNLGPVDDDSLAASLMSEVARLRPWADETRRARGRSLFGISGAAPDQVEHVASALASIAETGEPGESDVEWAFDMPVLIRHLTDDLRTYYHEAIAAQPGSGAPNHEALNDWIFGTEHTRATALGSVVLQIGDRLTQAGDPLSSLVRGLTIPEGRYRGGSAF